MSSENPPPPRKPFIIRILRTLKRQYHHAKRYGKKGETEHQKNERIMARWTRLLGILTFVLAVIASLTAWILYETDQNFRIAQRAFVGPKGSPVHTVLPPLPGQKVGTSRLSPRWENTGNTPTRDLHFYTLCNLRSLIFPPWPPARPLRLLVPKQDDFGSPCDLTPQEVTKIANGSEFYVMAIRAEYRDVFSKIRRVTEACWRVNIVADTPDYIHASFDSCPIHNCADEDCEKN
jgi:hypothetical protein